MYNSNTIFLKSHLGIDKITFKWLDNESETMKQSNFNSYKIIKKDTNEIVGFIDFKIDNETYLSLLMVHNKYKNKGIGKSIYKALEKYVKSLKGYYIRIDVLTNYDNNVINFWRKNGFNSIKDIKLNWGDKILSAVTMKKKL